VHPCAGARGSARAGSPTWATINWECGVGRVPGPRVDQSSARGANRKLRALHKGANSKITRQNPVGAWRRDLRHGGRSNARTERCRTEPYDRPTCS
jgi:hypothetical protein